MNAKLKRSILIICCLAIMMVGMFAAVSAQAAVAVNKVTLNKTTLSLHPKDKVTLKATVYPSDATDKSLTWVTGNENVAKVSASGVVTAVGKGSCSIVARSVSNKAIKAVCTVKVTDVAVTKVKLNKSSMVLSPSQKVTLKPTVYPSNATNKGLTWVSGNTKVAKVSASGVVTAVGKGSCSIVARSKSNKAIKAVCTVKVVTAPTKLKMNKSSLSLFYFGDGYGQLEQLKVTISPSSAYKTVKWTSSNTKVAKVASDGRVKATGKGTCTITATSAVNSKIKATCKITVTGMTTENYFKKKMLPRMDDIYNVLKMEPESIKDNIGVAKKAINNVIAFCKMHPRMKGGALTYANRIKTYLNKIEDRCEVNFRPNDSTMMTAIKNANNTLKSLKSYCQKLY